MAVEADGDARTVGHSDNADEVLSGYRVNHQIGFILRQASQRHVAIFSGRVGDRLTTTQWAALSKLREIQPSAQNHLGRETGMDVATIKGVVDRLVARGLVATAPDPDDGRRLVLWVTEEGDTVIRRNLPSAIGATDDTLAPLTIGERLMLLELLHKIS